MSDERPIRRLRPNPSSCDARALARYKNRLDACEERATCSGADKCCGQKCVDTDTNKNHCGGCGKACVGGKVCVGGTCDCPLDQYECLWACYPPCAPGRARDPKTWGDCECRCGIGVEECGEGCCLTEHEICCDPSAPRCCDSRKLVCCSDGQCRFNC